MIYFEQTETLFETGDLTLSKVPKQLTTAFSPTSQYILEIMLLPIA